MRSLSALLFVLILCSLQSTCRGTEGSNVGAKCCPQLVRMKIPLHRITSYWKTKSNCSFRAVVFKTIVGREFCVDASASWVAEHMKKLKIITPSVNQTVS